MTKQELRRRYLEKRAGLSPAEIQQKSRDIAARFFDNFNLASIRTVHLFIAISKFKEVDTSFILQRLWQEFPWVQTIAPTVDHAAGAMEHVAFDTVTELVENRWNIREPADGDRLPPEQIDMVLVPGLCFDRHGHRVGYGKGFYDRFLRETRPDCTKIGLSYFGPVDKIDDAYEGDVRVDHCVSPDGLFTSPLEGL